MEEATCCKAEARKRGCKKHDQRKKRKKRDMSACKIVSIFSIAEGHVFIIVHTLCTLLVYVSVFN